MADTVSSPGTDEADVRRSRRWQTRDVVVAAALAVPLALVWVYGWGIVWLAARGIIPELGLLVSGFYIVGGPLVAYIIRRPGAALLGEMLASLIEIPLTPFGLIVLLLGFLQGIGPEAVFASTRYRNFSLAVLLLAGAAGAAVKWLVYDLVWLGSYALDPVVLVVRFIVALIGGALFAGLGAKLIGDALAATGVLNNFPIGRARQVEV